MVAPRYGSISATGNPVTVVTCLFEDLSRSCSIYETPTAIRHRSTDIAAVSRRQGSRVTTATSGSGTFDMPTALGNVRFQGAGVTRKTFAHIEFFSV